MKTVEKKIIPKSFRAVRDIYMKKVYYTLAMMVIVLSLTGCAKCISTETSTVKVKITDEYYRASYITYYYDSATKTMHPLYHPGKYIITVEYSSVEYHIDNLTTYKKYRDKVGEYANGILRTKTFDDGSVRYSIVGLE